MINEVKKRWIQLADHYPSNICVCISMKREIKYHSKFNTLPRNSDEENDS